MRDIGLCVMAQNDADLLTDNLQSLREDLTYSNGESAAGLARRLRCGLQKVGALLSSAHQARSVIIPKGHVLSTFELPGTMLPGNSISDMLLTVTLLTHWRQLDCATQRQGRGVAELSM